MTDTIGTAMTATTTTTEPHVAAPALKRCAILGTAMSWTQCPWGDKTLEVWGLNDGYLLGVPRADRWFDLHPFHQMNFRPASQRKVRAEDVLVGQYLRPEGHLDWLKSRQHPVFLAQARPDFTTSRTFPKDDLLKAFAPHWPWRLTRQGTVTPGPDYEVSTPSWMLMLAIAEGYREIHIYGIHLATEWEYVQQRPNFEYLIGLAAGLGIRVVLPDATPICRARYQYAFAPKADLPLQVAQQDISRIKSDGAEDRKRLEALPFYARSRRLELRAHLNHLDVELLNARSVLQREQMLSNAQ